MLEGGEEVEGQLGAEGGRGGGGGRIGRWGEREEESGAGLGEAWSCWGRSEEVMREDLRVSARRRGRGGVGFGGEGEAEEGGLPLADGKTRMVLWGPGKSRSESGGQRGERCGGNAGWAEVSVGETVGVSGGCGGILRISPGHSRGTIAMLPLLKPR